MGCREIVGRIPKSVLVERIANLNDATYMVNIVQLDEAKPEAVADGDLPPIDDETP